MNATSQCCRLCRREVPLKVSHIIPKFVFRWLKESSATGYFRSGLCPDRRQQDGHKRPMLCDACEQRFSVWEREFAESVFSSLRQGQGYEPFQYGPWLAKFAVSLSWRVLLELQSLGALSHLPPGIMSKVGDAEAVWRPFLLDHRQYVSPFDTHLVPLGFIASHTAEQLPPNINRYFACSVGMDVIQSPSHTFVFTKLPFAVVIGLIQTTKPWDWVGTRLHPDGGGFGKDLSIEVPGGLGHYMNSKAVRMSEVYRNISENQRAVIDEFVNRNPDRVANSRTFEAMLWDADMFGSEAFEPES